jgi:hypothetical protein
MASPDFIRLINAIHKERYQVLGTHIEGKQVGEAFELKASVELEKAGKQMIIESSEQDFVEYVLHWRRTCDLTGEYKLMHIKDLNKYWADVEHLMDEDRSKVKNALQELVSGKFVFKYDPVELVKKFLIDNPDVRNKSFLSLKNDYHYILALVLHNQRGLLVKSQEKLLNKYPEARKFIDVADYFLRSFRQTGNPIKDYRFFNSFINFDMNALYLRTSTQFKVINDTMKEFVKRGTVDGDIAVPKMMDVYGRYLELSAPIINLLRIGMELKNGVSAPEKQGSLGYNIMILKSDSNYGLLFSCLDEMIRHSDAHAAIEVSNGKVHILDARSRKVKVLRTYTFQQIGDMARVMQHELFPAFISELPLYDAVSLDLVLISQEYKFLLLAIGNS